MILNMMGLAESFIELCGCGIHSLSMLMEVELKGLSLGPPLGDLIGVCRLLARNIVHQRT